MGVSWGMGMVLGALVSHFFPCEHWSCVWICGLISATGSSLALTAIYMYTHKNGLNEKMVRETVLLDFIGLVVIIWLYHSYLR